ncbi:MAG: dNTP triphosphohydrolase [Deltaproteobacteria bacterium]|nr:dNTP triphosphohydrolase [Deltaproteobacteria bacterium]
MRNRKEYEDFEKHLAPYAMKSGLSEGREFQEEEHPFRTCFQRDRDRVIHSNAFRRLEYKTQVFVYHEGDHYRTRLTHSLEGSQIARTITRALRLNEDLAEAIILAHDLGHTPFGHSGEAVMNRMMKEHGGFEHNRQSLRIVTLLEDRYSDFPGLNLTYEVREGIAKHQSTYDKPNPQATLKKKGNPTLEAQIVNLADEIAYSNHDLDDGLRSGLITIEQLKEIELWEENFAQTRKQDDLKIRNRQNPKILPPEVSSKITQKKDPLERIICDYIAGMTDRFALDEYNKLFNPLEKV